jgi:sugar lactone lactonase YvrE
MVGKLAFYLISILLISSCGNGTTVFNATYNNPYGITSDGTNLYVADSANSTIRKIVIATGVATTFAGTAGVNGFSDGTGSNAGFYVPYGITSDGTNLYVADTYNGTIRQIVISSGVVTTLAGTAGVGGSSDGTGPNASFNAPYGVTADGAGNLYVTDTGNSTIRKIVIATGVVTTLAGTAGVGGSSDGTGPNASFSTPSGITTDGAGNLYVSDASSSTIRKVVIATGVVTTLVGTAGVSGSSDGTGPKASFNIPYGITADGAGNLYVADTGNSTIRKIVIATGAVTTLDGTAGVRGSSDGTGSAARFTWPYGIIIDGADLYMADSGSNTISQIVISTGEEDMLCVI